MWCKFLKTKIKRSRYVQLSDFQSYYNTINNHMKTPYFKAAIRERFYKIEGLFSELNDFTDSKGHNSDFEKIKFKPFLQPLFLIRN